MSQEMRYSEPNPDLYSPKWMDRYDLLIVRLSHLLAWRVPNRTLCALYDRNIGGRHLEVGPGSGYFLDHMSPAAVSRVKELRLLDLNPAPLAHTRARLEPKFGRAILHEADALQKWPFEDGSLDSVGSTMVLHCLPRPSMLGKAVVFEQAARVLRPGGRFFGCTILAGGEGITQNWLARRLMATYNSKENTFHNSGDTLEDLRSVAEKYLDDVTVTAHGTVGVWEGTAR